MLSNAGGLNPAACREAIRQIAAAQGISLQIAIVTVGDVRSLLPMLRSHDGRQSTMATMRRSRLSISARRTLYGAHPQRHDSREAVMRIAVRHHDKAALEFMRREVTSPGTSMASGRSGYLGAAGCDRDYDCSNKPT